MVSATIPLKPLTVNHFLFVPKKGKPLYKIMPELIEKEIMERANTSSCAGIFCKPGITLFSGPVPNNLTKKFTTTKDKPDRTM